MSKLKEESLYNIESHLLADKEELELKVSLLNLNLNILRSDSKLQLSLYIHKQQEYHFLDETEILPSSSNLNFVETLFVPYSYMWGQILSFQLFDLSKSDNPILRAKATITLGEVVTAKNRKLVIKLGTANKPIGDIKLKWNIPKLGRYVINVNPVVSEIEQTSKVWFVKSVPLVYSYSLARLSATGDFLPVYQSENHNAKKKIHWNELTIPAIRLCKNSMQRPLSFNLSIVKKGKEKCVAQTIFSLESLLSSKNDYNLADLDMQTIKGKVNIQCKKTDSPYVLELINSGLKFNYMYGIDFSDSSLLNGVEDQISLHHSQNEKLSPYQNIITEISKILHFLNPNNSFAVYGFGRSPDQSKSDNVSSSCFTLNDDPANPWVSSYKSVGKLYNNSLSGIKRGGRPILQKIFHRAVLAAKYIKLIQSEEYIISVILTDGRVQDLNQAIACLKEAEDLPLSILVVGIGEGDFEALEVLDGDEAMRKIEGRNFVKFIKYSDFQDAKDFLGYELLRKLPQSIKDYYQRNPQSSGHQVKLTPEILSLGVGIYQTNTNVFDLKNELQLLLESKSDGSNSTEQTQ